MEAGAARGEGERRRPPPPWPPELPLPSALKLRHRPAVTDVQRGPGARVHMQPGKDVNMGRTVRSVPWKLGDVKLGVAF